MAAAGSKGAGQKNDFAKLWKENNPKFILVKKQYQKMLSSTPDNKATAWREKMGIDEPAESNESMKVDTNA